MRPRQPLWGFQFSGSRLRRFTRPCVSVNALRHTWGTRAGSTFSVEASSFLQSFCVCSVARSKVIGELSGQGTNQLRGLVTAVRPSRTFGSLPASRIRCRCRPLGPAAHRTALAARCLRRWVEPRFRGIVWHRTVGRCPTAPTGRAGLCAGCSAAHGFHRRCAPGWRRKTDKWTRTFVSGQ